MIRSIVVCSLVYGTLAQAITPVPLNDITPVPKEQFNPHLNEFRRMDSNNDEAVSFSEFLLADRPYIEAQSRNFHKLDADGNGMVTRAEYEGHYKKVDEERKERERERESFFRQMNPSFDLHPFQFGSGSGNDNVFSHHNLRNEKENSSTESAAPTTTKRK